MKKVGILTVHSSINFGAVLQAYSLMTILKKKGFDAEFIDYQCQAVIERENNKKLGTKDYLKKILWLSKYKKYDIKIKRYKEFMDMYYKVSNDKYKKSNIREAEQNYDYIITGSDQIWNFDITGCDTSFMLDFVENSNKKKSYAASFGYGTIPDKYFKLAEECLKTYSTLLVREESGEKEIREKMGLIANTVLDPTLLLQKNEWEKFLDNRKPKEEYILIYTVASPKYLFDFARNLSKETGYKIKVLKMEPEKERKGMESIYDAGPIEFLNYINNAKYILTTSFHGLIFSLIFNKDFYFEANTESNRNTSRLTDLAIKTDVLDRRIVGDMLTEKNQKEIDWKKINRMLDEERKKSIQMLVDSLED